MSNVIDIDSARRKRATPRRAITFYAGGPPGPVAFAQIRGGHVQVVVRQKKTKFTPAQAETLARGLLTLAESARKEGSERR